MPYLSYDTSGAVVRSADLVGGETVPGWVGRRFDFPVAPVIVGMILGPMSEKQLRLALTISQGDWLVFVKQPICAAVLTATSLVLLVPYFLRRGGIRLGEDD